MVLVAVGLTGLGGCGSGGHLTVGDKIFNDSQFSFTFSYPNAFHMGNSSTPAASTGKPLAEADLVLDAENGVLVLKYQVKVPVTVDNLEQLTPEIDGSVSQLAGSTVHGTRVLVGGLPGLRYDDLAAPKVVDGKSRIVFLFDQKTEYEINCQSTPVKRVQVTGACDKVLSTLKSSAGSASAPTPGGDLAAAVITPPGYRLSTLPGNTSGPIDTTQFDDIVGRHGAAASLHFVRGYLRDYDSTTSSDTVFVALFEFSSAAAAAAFQPTAATTTNAQAPVQHEYGAIPGALSVDATNADSDGFRVHAVVATKHTIVMSVEIAIKADGPAPKLLAELASQQYGRL